MVTWQRELGERDDFDAWAGEVTGLLEDRADALVVYDGIGPDEVVPTSLGVAVASILVGLTVGVILLVVLWLLAVWMVKP